MESEGHNSLVPLSLDHTPVAPILPRGRGNWRAHILPRQDTHAPSQLLSEKDKATRKKLFPLVKGHATKACLEPRYVYDVNILPASQLSLARGLDTVSDRHMTSRARKLFQQSGRQNTPWPN
jgi:hypothetical protein